MGFFLVRRATVLKIEHSQAPVDQFEHQGKEEQRALTSVADQGTDRQFW
jgi:hypothetical protein